MHPADPAPIEILDVANELGEGILWDARSRALWWTDIPRARLFRLDWSTHAVRVHELPERLGSFGLVRDSALLVAAFASGIALYDPPTGGIDWLARPDGVVAGTRFNDGRVDRRGRFWAGTMVEGTQSTRDGRLYCMGSGAALSLQLEGIRIANGLCMSPDGTRLYFTDTPTRTLRAYEMREPEGILGPSTDFARTPEGSYPDGATVDADGCVWSAHWGGGCVVRYTPDGRVDRTLRIPASQPSCVCFAGPDLDVLCVTTAREDLDSAALAREPHAGGVFFYRVGTQGLREEEYRI
jgi:sugar lactone lactonase YvrE